MKLVERIDVCRRAGRHLNTKIIKKASWIWHHRRRVPRNCSANRGKLEPQSLKVVAEISAGQGSAPGQDHTPNHVVIPQPSAATRVQTQTYSACLVHSCQRASEIRAKEGKEDRVQGRCA